MPPGFHLSAALSRLRLTRETSGVPLAASKRRRCTLGGDGLCMPSRVVGRFAPLPPELAFDAAVRAGRAFTTPLSAHQEASRSDSELSGAAAQCHASAAQCHARSDAELCGGLFSAAGRRLCTPPVNTAGGAQAPTRIQESAHAHTHACYAHARASICARVQSCVHACTHAHARKQTCMQPRTRRHARTHACTHARTHTCRRTHECTRARTHACRRTHARAHRQSGTRAHSRDYEWLTEGVVQAAAQRSAGSATSRRRAPATGGSRLHRAITRGARAARHGRRGVTAFAALGDTQGLFWI